MKRSQEDIYEQLDDLRKRPALYLGNIGKKSFAALIAFVYSLGFAEMDSGDPCFWSFSNWISARINEMSSTTLPWDWMEDKWGSKKAFDKFFEYLDEYRTCTKVYLLRAILREHKPGFYYEGIDGEKIEPEKPLEICIAQFAPSQVYYLLEVYICKQDDCVPYKKSVDEVKVIAKSRWRISEDEWFDV